MYYKFKIFKLNIEIQGEKTFHFKQIEILPRLTIMYGNMKMIALEWLYWCIDIEFYK